jgi:hypothetical protein
LIQASFLNARQRLEALPIRPFVDDQHLRSVFGAREPMCDWSAHHERAVGLLLLHPAVRAWRLSVASST